MIKPYLLNYENTSANRGVSYALLSSENKLNKQADIEFINFTVLDCLLKYSRKVHSERSIYRLNGGFSLNKRK